MKTRKTFDCVELKNKIQAQLFKAHRGMSDKEVGRAVQQKLAISKSPVARLWRMIQRRKPKDADQVQPAFS